MTEEVLDIFSKAIQTQKGKVSKLESKFTSLESLAKSNKEESSKEVVALGTDLKLLIQSTISSLPPAKTGRDGRDGLDGERGKPGIDGEDGLQGLVGKTGPSGKDGKNGVDGKDGKSAPIVDVQKIVQAEIAKAQKEKKEEKKEKKGHKVSVEDVTLKDGKLVIKQSDGKTKTLTIKGKEEPKPSFQGVASTGAGSITPLTARKIANEEIAKVANIPTVATTKVVTSSTVIDGSFDIVFVDVIIDTVLSLVSAPDGTVINVKRIDTTNSVVTLEGSIDEQSTLEIANMENFTLVAKASKWYVL